MAVRELTPVPPTEEREEREASYYEPMQRLTRDIAFDNSWTKAQAAEIVAYFDALAPEWHTRGGEERLRATEDALLRGAVATGGVAVEIGSGTGIHTPLLLERFDHVVSVDLSPEMLALTPRRERDSLVRADAGRLPLADGAARTIVCVNAYLFPAEYARVLSADGTVVFVSSSGEHTPIFLPAEDVRRAFEPAFGADCDVVTSRHGWATWTTVARRRS